MSTQSANRLCFFGKPSLYENGAVRPFGCPRRAIALLAYLIQHRNASLSREVIAELFWPDDEPEDARAALRRHLHRVLTALPQFAGAPSWVTGDKNTIRWNPTASIDVDVADYEELIAAGDRERAAALYRGDYMEDFHDEWILAERERLRQVQASNLSALIEARRKALVYDEAITFAQHLSALEPLREDEARRLMSLRFASGDRSGALTEFERFKRRLRDELDTDPMPETVALRDAIVRGSDAGPAAIATIATQSARGAFAFVGRARELQMLGQHWTRAAHGNGSAVLVTGEAGIGKSRLLAELAAIVETQGGTVLVGTTSPLESMPYQPIVEALRHGARILQSCRLPASTSAVIDTLVPDFPRQPADARPFPPIDPARDRRRLLAAIDSAFERMSERRPLTLILEDIQWAGSSTHELLEFIVARAAKRKVLVVASVREGESGAAAAIASLLRIREHVTHLALSALTRDDVRELVSTTSSDTSYADELYTASEGNALFATELLRERMSDRPLRPTSSVVETVERRVSVLSEGARAVLDAAAVCGAGFDAEIVRSACGWTYAEFYRALDELFDLSLVRESLERRGDMRFSHQLVHAAAYDAIAAATRRRLHHRVARTLERAATPSLETTIARHYDAADEKTEAVSHYAEGARYAVAVFANSEAIALATRGLELCATANDTFSFLEVRESALFRLGDFKQCRTDCEAMLALAQETKRNEFVGEAYCRLLLVLMQIGDREVEERVVADFRAFAEGVASPRWLLESAIAAARLAVNRSDFHRAESILADVRAFTEERVVAATLVDYWALRAHVTVRRDPAAAREFIARARECAGETEELQIRVLRQQGHVEDFLGDPIALARTTTELLERYTRIGDIEGQALAHQNLAIAAWYRCEILAQREHNAVALDLFERLHKRISVAAVRLNCGVHSQHLGDYDAAEADYRVAQEMARAASALEVEANARANRASLALARGDAGAAKHLALLAIDFAGTHGLRHNELDARVYLGEAEAALGSYAAALAELEAVVTAKRTSDPRGVLEVLIDLIPCYLGVGRVDAAKRAAEELLEADLSRVTFPAQALSVTASAFAAAGEHARADELRADAGAWIEHFCAKLPDDHSRAGYRSLLIHRPVLEEATPA